MYLENSQDILNITKAVSIFALAGFACWLIYYLARITQSLFRVIKEMQDRLHKIDEILKAVKEKIESSASYLILIVEGVKKLVEVMGEKKKSRKSDAKKEE
jgi:hypothetical protein